MLKKLTAFLLAAALLPLTAVPDGCIPILKAHAEEDIEYGVWYTETENGASYCWMLEDAGAIFRLSLKGNGDECIIPDYKTQKELPWVSYCETGVGSLIIYSSFTCIPEIMFQNYRQLVDVTILGNHYYDENRGNDIPLHAFDGCVSLKMFYGDSPAALETEEYQKDFEAYSGETHLAEMGPQFMAAYYGCEYIGQDDILAEGDFDNAAPYGHWTLEKNGDLWIYADNGGNGGYQYITREWDAYAAEIRKVKCLLISATVESDVFKDCVNLESVQLPRSTTFYATLNDGHQTFQNCTSLKEIMIPDGGNLMNGDMFKGCASLERIEYGEGVSGLLQYGLGEYPALKELRFLNNRFTGFNMTNFSGCTALEELYVPDNAVQGIFHGFTENMKCLVIPPLEDHFVIWNSDTSNLTVFSLPSSYVEEYCTANDIKFSDVSALFNITEEDGVISGDFHKQPKLSWTLDAEGTLTISGRGNMEWLQTELLVPWYGYREQIKKIVVEDGIYQILDGYYFKDCPNATSLHLPDSVYKIDVYKNDASADISTNYTIHAHKDSYAALFAARNGLDLIEVPRYSYRYQSNINNWSFLNTADYFRSSDTHFILDSYRERLMAGADDTTVLSSVSNTEKKRMEKMLESSWNGSCWGMAVTSILSCYDQFDFSDYDASATHLHDLQNTEEVESLLNYYWALQFTNEMRTQIESYKKQKDVVKVEDLLTNIADEKPTLLAYSFPAGSHAVVAYDYTVSEEGGYVFEIDGQSYTYDIRINLYDNITDNSEHLNPDACMYVNTGQNGYYQWYIPEYNAVHNSKLEKNNTAALSFVCSDVETLNYHGYLSGNDKTSGLAFVSSLETDSIDGVKIMENKNILSMEPVSVYDGEYPADDCFRFPLEGTENPCTAELKGEGEQSLTMNYAECMLSVCAEQADLVKFQPGGTYMTVTGNGAVCEMELVFNDESCITDWYALTVRCDTPSKQYSVKKATASENGKNGYILNSDSAIGRFVAEAENDSDMAGTICSTELKSVLLYEIDPATIGILGDADGDGVFETTLSAAGMQLLDVIRLQKYILCQTDLTRTECSRYDLRQDDVINGYDLALLKRAVLAG